MGVSTDGILAFGVDLGEPGEVELPWDVEDEDDGFEEWYARLNGLSDSHLWDQYNEWEKTSAAAAIATPSERLKVYEAENPGWRAELDTHYAQKRALEPTRPLELVRHCSGDYPMIILAVPGSVTTAHRGSPKVITGLTVDGMKLQAATSFCEAHGLPFDNPTWLLASMWW